MPLCDFILMMCILNQYCVNYCEYKASKLANKQGIIV